MLDGIFSGGGMASMIIVLLICLPLLGGALWALGFFEQDSKSKKVTQFYSNRWMTKTEAQTKYIYTTLSQLKFAKKVGTLVRFEVSGSDVQINMNSKDYHAIILGTTGSGKTEGFVLPYVYTLGHSEYKPNMVITDPKGEIYMKMSETLRRQGYNVQVLNLSEPTKSSRWNPFENAWNKYQRAQNLDRELKRHKNVDPRTMGLRVIASQYPNEWFEFNKIAFPTFAMADLERKTLAQRLISDVESDLKDICSAICPITKADDPSWEEGARDLIQGTAIAMLEDSLNPNLGMTKEKFNFYNIFKILGLRDNDPQAMFKTIKSYFDGRDKLSPAVGLAQAVISNADKTMQNFFGVVNQKLAMFQDKGICFMTSGTDVYFEDFLKKPTAFFMIIPDQIKVRHTLATLCVAQMYKQLVELANGMGGKLPRETYFILDEFGNMPKLNDFATIVTVARSRGIRLNLIIQDYKQLETVYGANEAITIRNNCNIQILLGVNDEETRKIFSGLLGEMAIEIENESVSKNTGKAAKEDPKGGSTSTSKSTVSRPLLPPNELLDMKQGDVYVYCFGLNPYKGKNTLFWDALNRGVVKIFKEPDEFIASKFFDEANIYYDVRQRNDIVHNVAKKNDLFDW